MELIAAVNLIDAHIGPFEKEGTFSNWLLSAADVALADTESFLTFKFDEI